MAPSPRKCTSDHPAIAFEDTYDMSSSAEADGSVESRINISDGGPKEYRGSASNYDGCSPQHPMGMPRPKSTTDRLVNLAQSVARLERKWETAVTANAELGEVVATIQPPSTTAQPENVPTTGVKSFEEPPPQFNESSPTAQQDYHDGIQNIRRTLIDLRTDITNEVRKHEALETRLANETREGRDRLSLIDRVAELELACKSRSVPSQPPPASYPQASISTADIGSYLTDQLERLQLRVTLLENRPDDLHADLKERIEVLAAAVEGGTVEGGVVKRNAQWEAWRDETVAATSRNDELPAPPQQKKGRNGW